MPSSVGPSPRSQPVASGKPSSVRALASERSYKRLSPVVRSRASAITPFQRSTPQEVNCATSVSL